MLSRGRLPAVWRRLAASDGYSLSEMIVVLAILLIVVTALTQLFVSGSNAEADMSKRVQAQQDARLALDKLRREIHCASAVTNTPPPAPPTPWPALSAPTSSITIALGPYCSTNTTGATATFTWCTVGSSAPFALWRYSGNACSGTGQKWADYLTTGQVFKAYVEPTRSTPWVASTAYTVGQYVMPTNTTASMVFRVTAAGTSGASEPTTWPTAPGATVINGTVTFQNVAFTLGNLSVELPVDVAPADAKQRYTLTDDIVLRNTR